MRKSQLSRRALLQAAAVAPCAIALERRFPHASAAPAKGGELSIAISESLLPKVQPLFADYAKKTGTTIIPQASKDADLYTQLTIALTQGTGAFDVVMLDDIWLPQFAAAGSLVNLRDLRERAGLPEDVDILPGMRALGQGAVGGDLYAQPWIGNVQLFGWRTDLLAAIGADVPDRWSQLVEVAAELTAQQVANGVYGVGVRGSSGEPAAMSFLPVLRGHGVDLIDPVTQEPQLATGRGYSAIARFLELCKQAPPGVDRSGFDELGINLYSGTIATSADIWPAHLVKAYDPTISRVVGTIAAGSEPAVFDSTPANLSTGAVLGIPTASKSIDRAFDFIDWLTAEPQQLRLLLEQQLIGTRASVLTDPEAMTTLPFLPEVVAAAKIATPRPRTPYAQALLLIAGRHIARAIKGEITGPDAMRKADDEMRALLVSEGVIEAT